MQDFFKSNDFTANFSLQHEITLTGAKAEVFGKAKYAFAKYCGINRRSSRNSNISLNGSSV